MKWLPYVDPVEIHSSVIHKKMPRTIFIVIVQNKI